MKSCRNEEYTIWTDYDGLDKKDIEEALEEWSSSGSGEDANGKE